MMTNTDLLFKTMDKVIEVAPEGAWNQGAWVEYDPHLCRTAGCFAGWSLMVDGGKPRLNTAKAEDGITYTDVIGFDMPDGTFVGVDDIPEEARVRLGLTDHEANVLFQSENTLEELKHRVDQITARVRI